MAGGIIEECQSISLIDMRQAFRGRWIQHPQLSASSFLKSLCHENQVVIIDIFARIDALLYDMLVS